MRDISDQIHSFLAATTEAATILSRIPEEVREALVIVLDVDEQFDLLDRDLKTDEIVSLLAHFSFAKPTLLAQVEFSESIIPDGVPIRLVEALAKHRNEIWLVHLNDADPFPSNPHAHNKENGLKLHLGTGDLYRKRDFVGKVRWKDLLAIREKLPSVSLPSLGEQNVG